MTVAAQLTLAKTVPLAVSLPLTRFTDDVVHDATVDVSQATVIIITSMDTEYNANFVDANLGKANVFRSVTIKYMHGGCCYE